VPAAGRWPLAGNVNVNVKSGLPVARWLAAIWQNGVLLWWVSTLVDTVEPRHAWLNSFDI